MMDLIAAISTAPAPSGVGLLRLSGKGAIEAAEAVFSPRSGRPLSQCGDRHLIYGAVCGCEGRMVDTALAAVSRAPHSYTGEDTAELFCHGSPVVLTLVLEALFAAGARQALPGEFTKRAFLNGKLDLTQSEAVIDLIHAETPAAAYHAAGQLAGALSERVEGIYQMLVDVMAHFHAVLDYPDEEIDPFREETIASALAAAQRELEALLATRDRGRHLTRGVPCVIVGRPNTGKSSLLNALLGYERAIVTNIPGTTRDTVEARAVLGGVLLRLIDTAGLRDSPDVIERMGVERSRAAACEAELVLLVIDGAEPLTAEDEEAIKLAQEAPHCVCVVNKSDLPLAAEPDSLRELFSHVCVVSAATGEGIKQLEAAVAALFPTGDVSDYGRFLTNARQGEAALRARTCVAEAAKSLAAGYPPDAVLMDVEEAASALGELSGKTVREDITARIFERFCVGK